MKLEGIVKVVTYYNPDNGYTVVKLTVLPNTSSPVTVIGSFQKLTEGESMELEGFWIEHQKYGKQFKAESYKIKEPKTNEHIQSYLAGGILKGVGPAQAEMLVSYFGDDTFRVLDEEPHRLEEIKKLSKTKRANIIEQWQSKQAIRDVMYFLQSHQITLNLSFKIYQKYGNQSVTILKTNPYKLADDIWGIGFLKADDIALNMGFERDSYYRIKAALSYTLNRSTSEGHVYLTKSQLTEQTAKLLSCPLELMVYTLDNLVENDDIYKDENEFYYLPFLYHSESGIAQKIYNLVSFKSQSISKSIIEKGIELAEKKLSSKLSTKNAKAFKYLSEQTDSLHQVIKSSVFLLTGGPGTGKTTLLLGLLEIFKLSELNVKMAAPTGKAAKRMSEVTGNIATTIHRLLQYDHESKGFKFNENQLLPADVLIIDELSMMDTNLMYSVIRAIKKGTKLILVGDPDQLPSVGPGKVLAELINSKIIPHLHLTHIMRQEHTSQIIINAHRINSGSLPEYPKTSTNFHFIPCQSTDRVINELRHLVNTTLPQIFKLNPTNDVQILTPMNKGVLGIENLNQQLQEWLNSNPIKLQFKNTTYKVGDKVMQLKNNYDKNVYNGDTGFITSIQKANNSLTVQYENEVEYEWESLDQINLAFASTIHKSQGSEHKAVILILSDLHYIMLQRNLFYTAITRAKEQVFLLGTESAIFKAVNNNPTVNRNTLLGQKLKDLTNASSISMDLPF